MINELNPSPIPVLLPVPDCKNVLGRYPTSDVFLTDPLRVRTNTNTVVAVLIQPYLTSVACMRCNCILQTGTTIKPHLKRLTV